MSRESRNPLLELLLRNDKGGIDLATPQGVAGVTRCVVTTLISVSECLSLTTLRDVVDDDELGWIVDEFTHIEEFVWGMKGKQKLDQYGARCSYPLDYRLVGPLYNQPNGDRRVLLFACLDDNIMAVELTRRPVVKERLQGRGAWQLDKLSMVQVSKEAIEEWLPEVLTDNPHFVLGFLRSVYRWLHTQIRTREERLWKLRQKFVETGLLLRVVTDYTGTE